MTVGYGIFSGGLDSMLSALVLREQGLEVRLLTFTSPFFDAERAILSARSIGLETRAVDLTGKYMPMLQKPRYGYGKGMNPCIDCHALMFREAGEIMAAEGGDFLFSGEVLGQRPKSQNRQAMDLVGNASGFSLDILRPLSAQLLPPTRVEELGLVDRSRLLALSGRTRKPQMELAVRYGVRDYPAPAGGCLLTDPIFARRLKELAAQGWHLDLRDVELLKTGRHFRLPGGGKLVVGRNQAENEFMEKLVRPADLVFHMDRVPGPLVILADGGGEGDRALGEAMAAAYSDAADGQADTVLVMQGERRETKEVTVRPKSEFADMMV